MITVDMRKWDQMRMDRILCRLLTLDESSCVRYYCHRVCAKCFYSGYRGHTTHWHAINHSLYLLCMNECLRIPQMSIIESTLQPFREMILWELLQQDKYPANLATTLLYFQIVSLYESTAFPQRISYHAPVPSLSQDYLPTRCSQPAVSEHLDGQPCVEHDALDKLFLLLWPNDCHV